MDLDTWLASRVAGKNPRRRATVLRTLVYDGAPMSLTRPSAGMGADREIGESASLEVEFARLNHQSLFLTPKAIRLPAPPSGSSQIPALAQAARRLLAHEAGEGSTSAQVAASAAQACQKLSHHLSRIVGDDGIRALLTRSLTLTKAEFPWLASAVSAPPGGSPWAQLHTCLEKQAPDVAIDASVSLVATFIGLLGKFIGEGLTLRLLHEVWPEIFPPSPPKETT
jgi:hypothetical protein